ncbi:MAG: hypothetical protein WKF96_08630 [Solirubrobacteraceae bacterium]
MSEDGREDRYVELVEQIEAAFEHPDTLGALRLQIDALDLDETDRMLLLSRISQYRIDMQMAGDHAELRGHGEEHGDPWALPASTFDARDPDLDDPADDEDLTGEWAPVRPAE